MCTLVETNSPRDHHFKSRYSTIKRQYSNSNKEMYSIPKSPNSAVVKSVQVPKLNENDVEDLDYASVKSAAVAVAASLAKIQQQKISSDSDTEEKNQLLDKEKKLDEKFSQQKIFHVDAIKKNVERSKIVEYRLAKLGFTPKNFISNSLQQATIEDELTQTYNKKKFHLESLDEKQSEATQKYQREKEKIQNQVVECKNDANTINEKTKSKEISLGQLDKQILQKEKEIAEQENLKEKWEKEKDTVEKEGEAMNNAILKEESSEAVLITELENKYSEFDKLNAETHQLEAEKMEYGKRNSTKTFQLGAISLVSLCMVGYAIRNRE